ncbi:PilC/PilY family type IV pilus protein [soil metagenome]
MKKYLLCFCMAAAAIVGGGLTHAEMSQVPLVQAGSSVPPNLMFTIDDSGSMDFECIPDALCYDGSNNEVDVMPWGLSGKSGAATVDENHIYNRQMRSSDVNGIYYDPTVRYQPWLKEDGTRYATYPPTAAPLFPGSGTTVNLSTTQTLNISWCTDNNSCATSSKSYYPAKYYTLAAGTSNTVTSNFTVTVIKGTGTTYPKAIDGDRSDCASTTVCTLSEELQNFTNWFTYASGRMLAAKGGTAEAFYNLPKSYRVGYGRINDTAASNIDGYSTQTIVRGLRPFDSTDRQAFYTWLVGVTPGGGTPLRRALDDVGQYFSWSDDRGPWGAVPGTADTTAHLACRKSFHILMTDGGWNGTAASTAGAAGNVDNTNGSTITGPNSQSYQYLKPLPYRDSTSGTLADVAMYYWNRDLQPSLSNEVKATTGNPAFWQHLVQYTVAFGQKGNLSNPADLAALTAGTKNWGTPSTAANNLANIDDLWHAALNSRGLSLSAQNPLEYANALRAIINDIDDRTGSEAGVAVSGRFLSVGSRKYVPEYRTGNWTGQLSAVTLDDQANDDQVAWKAGDHLPAHGSRNIFTFKDTSTKGITFTWASLTTQGMTSNFLITSADGTGMINYLRGDATLEGTKYRARGTEARVNTTTLPTLGDIVNSSPVWIKDLTDMQYDFLPSTVTARATYREFLRNKKFRVPQVIVGANDGMVHAFSDASGTETFAYFPKVLLPELKHLGDIPYLHQYYVDGPMMETDVHDGTNWRNLVVGTTGAGAKALFAINMPVPSSPSGTATLTTTLMSPGASDILWEVSNTGSFAELGYVLSTAEAGMTRDGSWVVITGNGYESASGNAQLFIINALTGALVKRIDTGVGGSNGLGGVRVVRDTKQQIVAVYAGDLKGNMWKFDLSSTSSSSWGVAFAGNPLFNAVNRTGTAEPFTAAPTYVLHPLGGVMILAGTGKLYETADPDNVQERTLYGLWDKVKVGAASGTATSVISSTATLVMQAVSSTLVVTTTSGDTATYYTSTGNTVDYATKRGWYLPLTIQAGERTVYDPQIAVGRVFFETVVPGAAVTTCAASNGIGYNFVLDPFSGASGSDGPTFDTNGDGIINSNDVSSAVGYKTNADGGDGILLKRGTNATGGSSGGVPGDACTVSTSTCQCNQATHICEPPLKDTCTQSAFTVAPGSSKQVCGDANAVRRSWRQLINPPS